MITILFFLLLASVFGRLFLLSLRAAWGLSRILVRLVFLPLILIFMVFGGLIKLAFPILAIIGLISLLEKA